MTLSTLKNFNVKRAGAGRSNGTFGELLQGCLPGVGQFLVTLPIRRYSTATFQVFPETAHLTVVPVDSWKSHHLVDSLLKERGLPRRGELKICSELVRGKGLASSTADLVASYRAVLACYGLDPDVGELERLLRGIEPSDGVMYDGIVAYLHREARLYEVLGEVVPLTIIAVDEGGMIDTMVFNSEAPSFTERDIEEYLRLLNKLRQAIKSQDLEAIGAVASRSAELNQSRLPKRSLYKLLRIADATNAAGVVVAHSGTFIGILFGGLRAADDDQLADCVERVHCEGLSPELVFTK